MDDATNAAGEKQAGGAGAGRREDTKRGGFLRRGPVALALMATVVTTADGGAALAALAPGFVGKVTLDSSFVTGAAGATDVAFAADGRALITTKTGAIVVRHVDGSTASIAYPFGGTLDTASEKGLLGVVADPQVASNGTFYFYVSNGTGTDKHRVYRAVLAAASDTLTVDPVPVIGASRGLGPGLEGPANHDGGALSIAGGKLYVGVGDTGSNASPPVNKYGSCLNKGNGKVLRVNLDGTIPTDNPLVGLASVSACTAPTSAWSSAAPDPRVFAWGLRNPWRVWVDPQTSLLWIGDVGESQQEEISIGGGNQHYGYPFVEGAMVWGNVDGMNCNTLTPSRACTPPAFSYSHAVGQAITGGQIVEGCGWSKVLGGASYVFGDSSANWVRVLPVNGARNAFTSSSPVDLASGSSPVALRMGPGPSLYMVFVGDGSVQRVTPVDLSGVDCAAPSVPATGGVMSSLPLAAGLVLAGVVLVPRLRRGPHRTG